MKKLILAAITLLGLTACTQKIPEKQEPLKTLYILVGKTYDNYEIKVPYSAIEQKIEFINDYEAKLTMTCSYGVKDSMDKFMKKIYGLNYELVNYVRNGNKVTLIGSGSFEITDNPHFLCLYQ